MGFSRLRDSFGRFDKRATATPAERFASNIERVPECSCWLWVGALQGAFGYGSFKWGARNSKVETAHRVAYKLFKGDIPDGLLVRHKCDNPACVNPDHLLLGTKQDNVDDCVKRGRKPIGEKTYIAKIKESAAREIRASKERSVLLGKKYGISRQAVADIRAGRTWKHV